MLYSYSAVADQDAQSKEYLHGYGIAYLMLRLTNQRQL